MSYNTILATTPLTSTGYHLKATGTTIGNSLIWDNGTNVGIGNTNTSYTLDVSGTGRFSGNTYIQPNVSSNDVGLYIQNNSTGGYGSSIGLGLYGYNTSAYFNPLRIESSYAGYGIVNFYVKSQSNSTQIAALNFLCSTGAATFSSSVTANSHIYAVNGAISFGGSGSAPSTDPAIYRIGGLNDLAFAIGSTERLRISANGALISTFTYSNTTSNAANLYMGSSGTFERSTSSLKYKTDVRDYDKGLNEVLKMHPVYYKGKGESDGDKQFAGLIAEEIEEIGLTEFVVYAEDGTPDALAYQNMIALLTKAIQEQNQTIQSLQEQINILAK